ncbi:MAG TPA: hypothetical protein VNM50_00135 [Chloroflexota bacterium]|nr:hypothetical protein [Chloroflexota bacterium]
MTTREALHALLDSLPDELLPLAEERLAALRDDSFLRFMMAAPVDDEPLTAEEEALIQEGEAEIARGEVVPWEEAEARLFPPA